MNQNIHAREISRELPDDIPRRYLTNGEPLFTAYGCALLERNTGKSWAYRALNLETGLTELITRRKNKIDEAVFEQMAGKIKISSIRGRSRLEADRKFGDNTTLP